ncbi:MAG: hypothetical protein ACFFC7_01850 [Candidatus Hermodarchaeota archaeon]
MIHATYLIDRDSGIPVLSQKFGEFRPKLDDTIISALLCALKSLTREMIKGKKANELESITLSGFKIVYAKDCTFPLVLVALVDRCTDSNLMREQLTNLLQEFCQTYGNILPKFPFTPLNNFIDFKTVLMRELKEGSFAHMEKPDIVQKNSTKSQSIGTLRASNSIASLNCY